MLLCAASQAFGATNPSEYPSLEIQGQRYKNVCLKSQAAKLKNMLLGGQVPNATQAWHIIGMLLCAPKNHANKVTVKKSIKGRVKRVIESTGEEPEQKWVRASEELTRQLMAGGRAWNADIDAGSRTIALQYYPNEACIRIVKLEYSGTKWIVYEFAEACD